MEILGTIIIGGAVLLVGYALLLEYLSNKDIRPVYHLIFGVLIVSLLCALCTNGCSSI